MIWVGNLHIVVILVGFFQIFTLFDDDRQPPWASQLPGPERAFPTPRRARCRRACRGLAAAAPLSCAGPLWTRYPGG
jgi:hypothetical protein